MKPSRTRFLLALSMTLVFSCDEDAVDEPICDATALQAALDSAAEGDVVRVGTCTIEGNFSVPLNVTLSGTERATSILTASTGSVVFLAGGATLQEMTIRSGGENGVSSSAGSIEGVRVEASRGAGLALQGGTVTVTGTEIVGPVDDPADPRWLRVAGFDRAGTCAEPPCECTPGETDGDRICDATGRFATWTAVYGLYAEGVQLYLTGVTIEGFAEFGAVLDESITVWNGGGAVANLGTGILIRGGSADLSSIDVERTAEGLRGKASYGIVAGAGAALVTADVQLLDNERYGLVLLDAPGTHTDLVASGNGDAGVWVGESSGVMFDNPTLVDNGFAGFVASDSVNVEINGGMIAGTRSVRRTLGELFGVQEVGDGVHLSACAGVTLRNLTLRDNERGGLLTDISESVPVFEGVDVESSAAGFGALAGDRTGGVLTVDAPAGWDSGIERGPVATTRDATAPAPLDAVAVPVPLGAQEQVGIVFPMI